MGEGLQLQTRSQKISRKGIFRAKGEVEHTKQGTPQVKRPLEAGTRPRVPSRKAGVAGVVEQGRECKLMTCPKESHCVPIHTHIVGSGVLKLRPL